MNIQKFYNKHYILLNTSNIIISGWSDGPHPEIDTSKAICINNKGGYQFRLFPDGEENPTLYNNDGIPLYKWNGSQIVKRTEDEINKDRLPMLISAKEQEIRNQCREAIINGFDINDQHFSLEETDQLNLTAAADAIKNGVENYPYHSDGNLCRLYTANEINTIVQAATFHKIYHTTLCNHILQQLGKITEYYQLLAINYSPECLSSELRSSFTNIMTSAQNLK